MSNTGDTVLEIFTKALRHYDKVLNDLKNSRELDISHTTIQEDIQRNLNHNSNLMSELNSPNALTSADNNRKFLCNCLRGYLFYLQSTKSSIITKLEDTHSLPLITFTNINEEIRKAESILKGSCEDKGM
jgi:hypothetical protein